MTTRLYAIAVLGLLACGGEKDPPIPPAWKLMLSISPPSGIEGTEFTRLATRISLLEGWELRVGGKPVGARLHDHNVHFEVPSSTPFAALSRELTLVGKTPCGEWIIPLPPAKLSDGYQADIQKNPKAEQRILARAGGTRSIDLFINFQEPQIPEMKSVDLVVDWGDATDSVRLGALELVRGEQEVRIALKEGCGAEHPVTIGGAAVGTWSAASAATFISVDPKRCYRLSHVSYGDAMVGTQRKILGPERVHVLARKPEHFLKDAPTSVQVGRDTRADYALELVRAECPADRDSAAGSAAPAGSAAGSGG